MLSCFYKFARCSSSLLWMFFTYLVWGKNPFTPCSGFTPDTLVFTHCTPARLSNDFTSEIKKNRLKMNKKTVVFVVFT